MRVARIDEHGGNSRASHDLLGLIQSVVFDRWPMCSNNNRYVGYRAVIMEGLSYEADGSYQAEYSDS